MKVNMKTKIDIYNLQIKKLDDDYTNNMLAIENLDTIKDELKDIIKNKNIEIDKLNNELMIIKNKIKYYKQDNNDIDNKLRIVINDKLECLILLEKEIRGEK